MDAPDYPERRLVVLGKTGSGKSATCNNILGRDECKSDPCGQGVTKICQRATCEMFGRNVQIIDTPGLFDTDMTLVDTTREVVKCIGMTAPGPHAFVMVVRIGRFTKEEQDTVEHFKKVFGENLMNHLMILFTGKDDLDHSGKTIETYLENIPQMLKDLLKSCGNEYIVFNNRAKSEERDETVQRFLAMVDRIHSHNSGKVYTNDMYNEAEKIMLKREEQLRQEHEAEVNKEYEAKMIAMEETQTEKINKLEQKLRLKDQQMEQQLEMEKIKIEIEKERIRMRRELELKLDVERSKVNQTNYREQAREEVNSGGKLVTMLKELCTFLANLVTPILVEVAIKRIHRSYDK